MKTKLLLPAEARKTWQSSTVAKPIAVIRGIFNKAPQAETRILVERCVQRGVLKATAKVLISKLKKKQREAEQV